MFTQGMNELSDDAIADWMTYNSLVMFFLLMRVAIVLAAITTALSLAQLGMTEWICWGAALGPNILFEVVYHLGGDWDAILRHKWPWAVWLFKKFDKPSTKRLGILP